MASLRSVWGAGPGRGWHLSDHQLAAPVTGLRRSSCQKLPATRSQCVVLHMMGVENAM